MGMRKSPFKIIDNCCLTHKLAGPSWNSVQNNVNVMSRKLVDMNTKLTIEPLGILVRDEAAKCRLRKQVGDVGLVLYV